MPADLGQNKTREGSRPRSKTLLLRGGGNREKGPQAVYILIEGRNKGGEARQVSWGLYKQKRERSRELERGRPRKIQTEGPLPTKNKKNLGQQQKAKVKTSQTGFQRKISAVGFL